MKTIYSWLCVGGFSLTVLAATSFRSASRGFPDSVPDLDSFSEAGVAAAVLKRHARELQEECADALRAAYPTTSPQFQAQVSICIARYRAELEQQKSILAETQLEHKLLILFKSSSQLDEFLNSYLRLAASSPEQPVIWRWAGFALTTADAQGRFDETWDLLRHVSRFHPNPEVAGHIRSVLEKWSADHDRAGQKGAP